MTDGLTDGQTDGQSLLKRRYGASKKGAADGLTKRGVESRSTRLKKKPSNDVR